MESYLIIEVPKVVTKYKAEEYFDSEMVKSVYQFTVKFEKEIEDFKTLVDELFEETDEFLKGFPKPITCISCEPEWEKMFTK